MTIYCDSLNCGSCIQIIQLCWWSLFFSGEKVNIEVLDPMPKHGWAVLLQVVMKSLGFRVEEAKFFTGHLKTPDGQVVYTAALSAVTDLVSRSTERILARSKLLAKLNREWGRNIIFTHIARSLDMPAQQIAMRILVVEALKNKKGENKVILVVRRHFSFDTDLLRALSHDLKMYFYRTWQFKSLKRFRASVLFLVLYEKLREIKWLLEAMIGKGSNVEKSLNTGEDALPSLLVLQEDDLSLDRSYRTQPHWLFAEDRKLPFKTLVFQTNSLERLPVDYEALKEQGIIPVSRKQQYLLSRKLWFSHHIQKRLYVDFLKCILASVFGSSVEIGAVFEVARLLYIANGLTTFCERNRVKAFMTCENYLLQADAISLIAPDLNITTLSYQYANAGRKICRMSMLTNADMMITFAPLYHKRYRHKSIRPKEFVDVGYVYDTSFKYLRERACVHRSLLEKAGAQFVICYFDENVQDSKYGLVSVEDHCAEIKALLKLVNSDPTIGLVIKAQFQWNTPQQFDEIANLREEALATGRYLELIYGKHRNIVFPAEAALVSDIILGHAIGATAPLEAALVGVRSILLNPYGVRSDNDTLYKQADIVYPSMGTALEAISGFREGSLEHKDLGDWTSIINQFDSFRDGCSGYRLRSLLEKVVMHGNVSAGSSDYPISASPSFVKSNIQ